MEIKNKVALVLTLGSLMLLASGCQSIQDQMGNKLAEKMVEGASGGKVKMDTGSGKMTMTDDDGKTVEVNYDQKDGSMNMKSSDGTTANYASGDKRPESAPKDLPSPDNVKNFSWIGSGEEGVFSYSAENTALKDACDKEVALLDAQGWKKEDNQVVMETSTTLLKNFANGNFQLVLSCSYDEDSKTTTVGMSKGKKTS